MADQTLKDIDRAFKALEERDKMLDNLEAEIETLNPVDYVSMSSYEGHRGASDMKDDVLRIIDKYKAKIEPKTGNDLDMKLKLMEANINGYTQGLKDASNTEQEPTCNTCEYNTAAFNPCNACENKSEYKRKEI